MCEAGRRKWQLFNTSKEANDSNTVFELPGGLGGVEPPQLFAQPPKHDALGYPGGGSVSTPPAVVNDAESPVCNGSDNE
jgi:hypothetical protein